MPRLLPKRFGDDSIEEFFAAAEERNKDALRLAESRRTAAAVYLWGYVAEMTLKAAWFRLIGYSAADKIVIRDLRAAKKLASDVYGIAWPQKEEFHNVQCWADLLTRHRAALGKAYPDAGFAVDVQRHGRRIFDRWRTVLRYKKNRAYDHEVEAVSDSAQWLLANALKL